MRRQEALHDTRAAVRPKDALPAPIHAQALHVAPRAVALHAQAAEEVTREVPAEARQEVHTARTREAVRHAALEAHTPAEVRHAAPAVVHTPAEVHHAALAVHSPEAVVVAVEEVADADKTLWELGDLLSHPLSKRK